MVTDMDSIKITDVRCNKGDSAFLMDDGKTAVLVDSGFGFTGYAVADNIRAALGERELDFILLTHSHYDHALGSAYILRRYPQAKVAAASYAQGIFRREGALRTMRELDAKFAAKCSAGEYDFLGAELRVDIPLEDGDIIEAREMRFEALSLPGHTRCSMGYYCRDKKLLVACESLGVYDGDKIITPSYLVSYADSMESISKVKQLDIKYIISPHYGLLNEEQTAFFLENMQRVSQEAAEMILDGIKKGESSESLIAKYKAQYRKGYVEEVYPEDAVNLNASIMIEMIRRELAGAPTDSDN